MSFDMVPQKNGTVKHDFEVDPIRPYIDGEWVKAQGTTLGAEVVFDIGGSGIGNIASWPCRGSFYQ